MKNAAGIDRRTLLLAGASLALPRCGLATEIWPTRNVQILVGFSAAGVTYVSIRLLAERLRPRLAKPIVIENRAGASGLIAALTVARAAPDGHTLLGMSGTITIASSVLNDVPIDVRHDLEPITIFATSPNVLIVATSFAAKTLPDFLTLVRSKPREEFAYASSGVGTTVHLMAGMFERAADIKMRRVPFRSSADSIQSVIAGELPVVFSSLNSALPFIQSDVVRARGVATEQRSRLLADLPTFQEIGIINGKRRGPRQTRRSRGGPYESRSRRAARTHEQQTCCVRPARGNYGHTFKSTMTMRRMTPFLHLSNVVSGTETQDILTRETL